ncbi:hypothetical protein [Nostoc linckia]|jgi:hypothetical protein|nr:hypothetical protein [Nostoc linckia]
MTAKVLSTEQLEKLQEIKKRLAELQQRSDERITAMESALLNK